LVRVIGLTAVEVVEPGLHRMESCPQPEAAANDGNGERRRFSRGVGWHVGCTKAGANDVEGGVGPQTNKQMTVKERETMSKTMSRGEIQDLVAKFAMENPKYRQALLKNPKDVLEKQLNTSLPANVKVEALQETSTKAYVVVPHIPAEGELDDADLEKVAGGFLDKNAECDVRGAGAMNTFVQINL
jgi:hypothetical protein